MTPIQSREEVASSIASGIASAAGSITAPGPVTLDGSSEYQEIVQLQKKFQRKPTMQPQLSGVLNDFVELIHGVAAEFVAMDSNIASNIDANTSNLPETSAAPGESGSLYQIRDTLQNNETNHLRRDR